MKKIVNKLKSKGDSNLLPCWELYITKHGKLAVWDKNDKKNGFRAILLPYRNIKWAIKFLNKNNINFHTYLELEK